MSENGGEEFMVTAKETEFGNIQTQISIGSIVDDTPQIWEERETEAKLERRLKWKIDRVILPLLALTYFFIFYGKWL